MIRGTPFLLPEKQPGNREQAPPQLQYCTETCYDSRTVSCQKGKAERSNKHGEEKST